MQLLTHPPEALLTSVEQMNDTFWKTSEVSLFEMGCLWAAEFGRSMKNTS